MTDLNIPDRLIDIIRSANQIAVLTGAGISAESGIPTFREAMTGLWAKYQAEELATPEAFVRDPALVWSWYLWRKQMVQSKSPNAGHRAIVELAGFVQSMTLITQNIDGLHQLAGSKDVIELHGNIRRSICFDNRHPQDETTVTKSAAGDGESGNLDAEYLDAESLDVESLDVETGTEFDTSTRHQPPPACPQCGSPVRPDVVWFGESLDPAYLSAAADAASSADLFFSIGTSSLVYPAAGLADVARQNGATIVEINPNPTPLTPGVDYALQGAGGVVLPALVGMLGSVS